MAPKTPQACFIDFNQEELDFLANLNDSDDDELRASFISEKSKANAAELDFLANLSDSDNDELEAPFISKENSANAAMFDLINSIFGSDDNSTNLELNMPGYESVSPIDWQSMKQINEQACSVTGLPPTIDPPLTTPKNVSENQ